ncbi:tRNA pseudouridine synthase A [bacterium HR17]|uniref:tRNA pseudouridine synthase A n=1 Tax=Candidatus Fervidibacter japonicus TaxID=2035412 RepID=A0A2H5XDR0_9BACT|nr:tRNA pseudouridine synthase A [bacterium HR17]
MRHIKLVVGYDGTDFHGFQRQGGLRTVQGELERTLTMLLGHEVRLKAAGRTDAGVHAEGQVVSFWTDRPIPTEQLPRALNGLLPPDIVAKSAQEVPPDFHPRFDATSRVYRYLIDNRAVPSALLRRYAWHIAAPLDVAAMREAARWLVGVHDFASFHASGSDVGSTVREMKRVVVTQRGGIIAVTLEANAFLYHMARIIVGTLVDIGLGKRPPQAMHATLMARDRAAAGKTAPAHGLCLMQVKYGRKTTTRRAN